MINRSTSILIILCLILTTGFLATSLSSFFVSRSSLRLQLEKSELPLTSDTIYSEIQRDLLNPIFISSLMANDTFLRDWIEEGEDDPEKITRYLREIKKKYGTFTSFFVSENTKNYYQAEGILKRINPDDLRDKWYFRVRELEALSEINVDPDMANKDAMTIFVNYRVLDDSGRFLGVTGVGLSVSSVKKLINRYQNEYQRNIYFTDTTGEIVLKADTLPYKENRIQTIKGLQGLADNILSNDHQNLHYKKDGFFTYLNTRFIPEFNWFLIVEQSESESTRGILRTLIINLIICLIITVFVSVISYRILTSYRIQLENMAHHDSLTGINNRRAFEILMPQLLAVTARNSTPLSFIILDIDHFKKINDTYGHTGGDRVLIQLTQLIQNSIRANDLFFRWGGEEFALALENCDLETASEISEKIRKKVMLLETGFEEQSIKATISLGAAELHPDENIESLIKRADSALYKAKKEGRNCSRVL